MSPQNEKQTVFIVETPASRCYTPFLSHTIEDMGLDVLTLGDPVSDRMDSILACIREADAVLITGRPDPDMAVVAGAAVALDRPVLHMCSTDDLTSANLAAAVSKIISAADDVVAQLQAVLLPDE